MDPLVRLVGNLERALRWAYPGVTLFVLVGLGKPDYVLWWLAQPGNHQVFVAVLLIATASVPLYTIERGIWNELLILCFDWRGLSAFATADPTTTYVDRIAQSMVNRFSATQDAMSDYLINRWAGTHAAAMFFFAFLVAWLWADSPSTLRALPWLWLPASLCLIGNIASAVVLERVERLTFQKPGWRTNTPQR